MIGAGDRIRLLADLAVGDTVRTPSGSHAIVRGFEADGVLLALLSNGEEMTMLPHLLIMAAPAPRHEFPKKFFNDKAVA